MEEVISASGDDPRVTFGPEVARAGVRKVLAGYDVLCCPSLALESGPIVAIEAHAAGTPVIGSRLGGLAETISDGVNGRLVPPGDVPALTAVLNEIARDPANTIDRWRTRLPRPRTMHDVASEYMDVYLAEKCLLSA